MSYRNINIMKGDFYTNIVGKLVKQLVQHTTKLNQVSLKVRKFPARHDNQSRKLQGLCLRQRHLTWRYLVCAMLACGNSPPCVHDVVKLLSVVAGHEGRSASIWHLPRCNKHAFMPKGINNVCREHRPIPQPGLHKHTHVSCMKLCTTQKSVFLYSCSPRL